jgi:hypothetical protein
MEHLCSVVGAVKCARCRQGLAQRIALGILEMCLYSLRSVSIGSTEAACRAGT